MSVFADKLIKASQDKRVSSEELRAWRRRVVLRLANGAMKVSSRQIVARKLCWFDGYHENTTFDGRAMWESYLDQADVLLVALDEDTETNGTA